MPFKIKGILTLILLSLLLLLSLYNLKPLNLALSENLMHYKTNLNTEPIKTRESFLKAVRKIRDNVVNLNHSRKSKNYALLDFNHGKPLKPLLKIFFNTQTQYHFTCDVAAKIYQIHLNNYGIKSRPVTLATQTFWGGKDLYATHVTIEVYDPFLDKMIIMDPTFGIDLHCGKNNQLLNTIEAARCLSSGKSLHWTKGHIKKDGLSIESYSTPYSTLFYSYESQKLDIGSRTIPSEFSHEQGFYNKILKKKY